MPLGLVEYLSGKSEVDWKSFGKHRLLPDNWGAVKGGKIGFSSFVKKYPEVVRSWRSRGGKTSGGKNAKEIKSPKISETLAEFIGIVIGDGTLNRNFIRISGDSRYDSHYFSHISKIIKSLFGLDTTISKDKRGNTLYLTVCSVRLFEYLENNFDLFGGDKIKNGVLIHKDLLKLRKISVGCLRGLVDTDGSISKSGNGMSLVFSSGNPKLLSQVSGIFESLGIKHSKYEHAIYCRSKESIVKYFRIVGSSNMKHIVRFENAIKRNNFLKVEEVLSLYKNYINLRLPFRMGRWSNPVMSLND